MYQREILIAYLDPEGREQLGTWMSTEGLGPIEADPTTFKLDITQMFGARGSEVLSVQIIYHSAVDLPLRSRLHEA